jgi:hypothetical protein
VAEFGLTGDDELDEDEEDARGGDCDRETGRVWMATSTFLQLMVTPKETTRTSTRTSQTRLV